MTKKPVPTPVPTGGELGRKALFFGSRERIQCLSKKHRTHRNAVV
jgi:hypothetical protein